MRHALSIDVEDWYHDGGLSPHGRGEVYNLNEKTEAGEGAINAIVLYPLDGYSVKEWLRARQARTHS